MYFYQKRDNFIYTFNPLIISFFCLLGGLISLLLSHPFYPGAVLLAAVLVAAASGNGKLLKGYLFYSFFLFLLLLIVNIVFSPGGHTVLASLKAGGREWNFTLEALVYGLVMGIKLGALIVVFGLFNWLVDPDWLFDILAFRNSRLSVLGNLTLRLFPLTVHDFRRIGEVQALRGLDFTGRPWREKVLRGGILLNSVLLSSLERALQMAEAMYARGYGGEKHSCYYDYPWRRRDYIAAGAEAAVILLLLAGWKAGYLGYRFYPELDMLKTGDIFLAGLVFLLLLFPAWLKWGVERWPGLRWII